MAPSDNLRKCLVCRQKFPIQSFPLREKRRRRRCIECDRKHEINTTLPDDVEWWSVAFHKSLLMQLNHKLNEALGLGRATPALTPGVLTAIMRLQKYSCGITSYNFVMPPGDAFGTYASFARWTKSLDADNYAMTPAVIRVRPNGLWEPGNVMFVQKACEPLCRVAARMGGLENLRDKLRVEPVIYSNEEIQDFLLNEREKKIESMKDKTKDEQ